MSYFILRHGQQYGPYSAAGLQSYLAAGAITLNDLARTEEMKEWLLLLQILGPSPPVPPGGPVLEQMGLNSPSFASAQDEDSSSGNNVEPMPPPGPVSATSGYAAQPGLDAGSPAPLSPGGLHWTVLLLLVVVALGLFGAIWVFIQKE